MKYYIEGILPRFDKIEQFYKKTETTKMIYSNEGIFYVLDNVLYRMVEIVDELPSEELKINRGKFMVDKNKIIYKHNYFC